jgi:Big-like domain-containing protein
MQTKHRLKERRGLFGISLAVALFVTLATGGQVAAAPTPLIDVLVVESSDVSTFRTTQLAAKPVAIGGPPTIGASGQFALTSMGPTGLAALTCSQLQAFDILYVPITGGGDTASRDAIKNNPAFAQCFSSSERAVVTGYHAEDHGNPGTGQFLYDAMVWIDAGPQVGPLILNDTRPSPQKYDFLQPFFPGVYTSVINAVTALDNIQFLVAHPIHANTTDGPGLLTMDNWSQTCHTTWTPGGAHLGDGFIDVSLGAPFNQTGGDVCALAKEGGPGPPANLTLTPKTDTNTVGEEHCVTATVTDGNGNPTPGITVRFSVTGSVNTSGSATTDANGQATFCYQGPALPGADVITAYADTNNNGVQDPGEPSDTATKEWVLPASTEGCKVTYGGRITAANGDKATFGGNAQVKSGVPKGQEQYRDHGPAQPRNVHSINVQAVTCSADKTQASIFGQATIDGAGSFDYRIDLKDLGEPGTSDTYRIRLSDGYDSAEKTLEGGNVQIHK